MFTNLTTVQHPGTSAGLPSRLSAAVTAVALAAVMTGGVAARELEVDDDGSTPSVICNVDTTNVADQHLRLKLATPSGCEILVYG